MKTLLNRRHLAATVLGTAITALSFTALAQNMQPAAPTAQPAAAATPAPQVKTPGHQRGPQAQAEHHKRFEQALAQRQSRLKDSLQLRPDQESAWKDFIGQTQPKPRATSDRRTREEWAQLNTPQRLDRLEALKAERDARMKQRNDGIRSFYGQLSPSQQKAFDAQRGLGLDPIGHRAHRAHKGSKPHGHQSGSHGQRS